ncbi:LicD family protein [Lachnospiraceae bacterium 29-91]
MLIQMDQENLRKLQMIELELLVEFDRICRKYKIRYTLTGGTLLGAVRHGGFIPWDDDADVSMLRHEYEKFKKVCDIELNDKYYFQDIQNTKGYRWGYGKLRKRGTLFLRENQEHMPYAQGVFIDVFPRDGVPDGLMSKNIHKFQCFIIRKCLWSEVGKVSDQRKVMRIWFHFLNWAVGDRIFKVYDRLVKRSNIKPTKLVRNLTFPVPNGYGYLRKWYEESIDLEFENHLFMVNKSYKLWLQQEFGEYMKIPPPEKRKTHPIVKIELE